MKTTNTLRIRKTVYRSAVGFVLSGRVEPFIFPLSIFVHYRENAIAIRDLIRANPHADTSAILARDFARFLDEKCA